MSLFETRSRNPPPELHRVFLYCIGYREKPGFEKSGNYICRMGPII